MKNQNDLIVIIVAAVLAIGSIVGFIFTAPKPIALPAPTPVPTDRVPVAEGAVVKADSLPGGTTGGGGGFGGGGGRRGGPMGGPAGGPGGLGRAGLSGADSGPTATGFSSGR